MIFDSHAHYDDARYDEDRDELLLSMREHNVGTIVNVGATLEGCAESLRLAARYDFVYAAIGVHPDEIGELDDAAIESMRRMASHEKTVAIGEIGLDYHRGRGSAPAQAKWFIRQMELAGELGLPICVHSRDAAQDTFDLLSEYGCGLAGVLHCYSYSPEMAAEYIKRGFYIGIGGVVTFKNAKKTQETARAIPLERILLETDCPYLAPDPHRGERNNSIYIDYVAEKIADLKGIEKEEVIACTEANARAFFGI